MTTNDYFKARAQWLVAIEAASIRGMIGGRNHPEDQAHLDRTDEAAEAVLKAITETPTASIDEITARAVVLSCIINEFNGDGDHRDFWPGLSARIAADLQNLAASASASSGAAKTEAIRCAA